MMHETNPDGATPDYMVAECPSNKRVQVKVEYPDTWFLKKPPKGYRVDEESFRRAWEVIIGTLKHGRVKDRYVATVMGQAYRPPFPSSPPPPPKVHVTMEGTWDAGIVISGIYDVRVSAK